MLPTLANIVYATSTNTPPSLNEYINGRKGPPLVPGVKIRLPIEPSPYEKHLLMPELITKEHLLAMSAIETSINNFNTPDTRLDPLFVGSSNTFAASGKRTLIPDIQQKLILSNGTNPKLVYTGSSRGLPVFSALPVDKRTLGSGDSAPPV